jgi:hypothetical protein
VAGRWGPAGQHDVVRTSGHRHVFGLSAVGREGKGDAVAMCQSKGNGSAEWLLLGRSEGFSLRLEREKVKWFSNFDFSFKPILFEFK